MMEALAVLTYVDQIMDTFEDLPNSLQRHLTEIRRLDAEHYQILRDIRGFMDEVDAKPDGTTKKCVVDKLKLCLAKSQLNGDDKLKELSLITKILDDKAELLKRDAHEFQPVASTSRPVSGRMPGRKPTIMTQHNKVSTPQSRPVNTDLIGASNNIIASPQHSSADSHSPSRGHDNKSKRPRRQKHFPDYVRGETVNLKELELPLPIKEGPPVKRKKSAGSAKKVKEVKGKVVEDIPIDPDEPTYCLCQQVSYGEMIGCDNGECTLEWFHFQCVGLSTKPKGKWFCPGCRGDKQNVLKPSLSAKA